MKSQNPGKREGNGSNRETGLLDLRTAEARQSVILVADDDVTSRNLVTGLLQLDGHSVLCASDGHEGLELSRQYPGSIDLLITGVQMSQLNGTELCNHLFQERPGIKAMFVASEKINASVNQDANVPLLTKPIDGPALIAKVRAILTAATRPPTH